MSNDTSWISNEQETRTNLILPKLFEVGWGKEGTRIREEFPISIGRLMGHNNQRATKLDADYVLEYKNTQLAVIEAKKTSKDYDSKYFFYERLWSICVAFFCYHFFSLRHYLL